MSGAAGHIMHLHEDLDLTFVELQDVLQKIVDGTVEEPLEKCDGLNLMVTCSSGEVKFARCKSEILSGGLTLEELIKRFRGRGSLTLAFGEGARAITRAVREVDCETLQQLFNDGKFWRSVEVVSVRNFNVIKYDGNNLIFHARPVMNSLGETVVEQQQYNLSEKHLTTINEKLRIYGWKVHANVRIDLQKLDDIDLDASFSSLKNELQALNLDCTSTLREFIKVSLEKTVLSNLPNNIAKLVSARFVDEPGAQTLTEIKKLVRPETKILLAKLNAKKLELVRSAGLKIEMLVHAVALKRLSGARSALISSNDKQLTEELQDKLHKACAEIEKTYFDPKIVAFYKKHLEKLGDLNKVQVLIEGVVFTYNNKTYKIVGNFAPVNQILGLVRYD